YRTAGILPARRRRRDAALPAGRPDSAMRTTSATTRSYEDYCGGNGEFRRYRRWSPSRSGLIISAEDLGDRLVLEDSVDGDGQDRGDRENLELVEATVVGQRQRVGDDHPAEHRVLEPVDRGVGEDAVSGDGDDVGRPAILQDLRRRADGAGGVDHVVDQDADPALDVADNLARFHRVGHALE